MKLATFKKYQRKMKLHYHMNCEDCQDIINIGSDYYSPGPGREYCSKCYNKIHDSQIY